MGKSNSSLRREIKSLKKSNRRALDAERHKIEALQAKEQRQEQSIHDMSLIVEQLQENGYRLEERVEELRVTAQKSKEEELRMKGQLEKSRREQKRDRRDHDKKDKKYMEKFTECIDQMKVSNQKVVECLDQMNKTGDRFDAYIEAMNTRTDRIEASNKRTDKRLAAITGVLNEVQRSVELSSGNPRCLNEAYQTSETSGTAVIINNVDFATAESRSGSCRDARNLQDLFKILKIPVELVEDLTVRDMKRKIDQFSSEARGSFTILCVLSHGSGDGVMGVDDRFMKYEDLWAPFTRAENLKGKPKVFIIQACGGNRAMGLYADSSPHLSLVTPSHSDILFACSTVAGYLSYRYPDGSGSFFIKELVSVIKEKYLKDHLEDMMTAAIDNVINEVGNGHYQVPVKTTTLRKKLYLTPPLSVLGRESQADFQKKTSMARRARRSPVGRPSWK